MNLAMLRNVKNVGYWKLQVHQWQAAANTAQNFDPYVLQIS